MKITHFTFAAWLISILFLTASCTEKVTVPFQEVPEPEYCSTPITHTPSYTITGTANYQRRRITAVGLSNTIDTLPIRLAEIKVVDSAGNTVQCGETLADGTFSLTVPQSGSQYTVKIISRAYNATNKASVLEDPYANVPYEITKSFTASSSQSIGTITASSGNSDLRGGAFNILDKIYDANYYLLNNTGGAFTVTHKVQAYWARGVNPVTYFGGDAGSGVSFYVPGTDKLYILGGIEGDVTVEDTDHYDDSVIVHEFGHFVEDNYSRSDSPGGTHYGTYAVDPRLAWSEAFSTFLATQVLNDPIYKDTVGITGGFGFYYDAENNEDAPVGGSTKDMPAAGALGEGNFRELAVLRFLWHAIDGTAFDFDEFWDIYTDEFVNTDPYREMNLYLQQQELNGTTDLTSLYDDDDKEMASTRLHYGFKDNTVTTDDGSTNDCRFTITASAKLPSYAGSTVFERSNQFYSNDFFYYYHPGGTLSVVLSYDLVSSTAADLDLYIYKNGYSYGVGDDLVTYSNKSKCPGTGCEPGVEAVSVSAPAGHYMINVMYYNDGAGSPATTYNLLLGGSDYLCK